MGEKAKRLAPTIDTLRELFAKSGNQCAFPGCTNRMINEDGVFVGQLCHIEAAEEGGERFNPNMNNEQRRQSSNLMLLCYEHHVVTNDTVHFTVDVLKDVKKRHEEKYMNAAEKMMVTVMDYGYVKDYQVSHGCKKLSEVLGYGLSDVENKENALILNRIIDRLKDVPVGARELLGIMVMRSYDDPYGGCAVPLHEIEEATGLTSERVLQDIDILKRRGIMSDPDFNEYNCPYCLLFGDKETGWNYWIDIREYCRKTRIPIQNICVDLNLSVFD